MEINNNWIDDEVLALQCSADWRHRTAADFPADDRNAKAAKLLDTLAIELRQISNGPVATKFRMVQDFLFTEGNAQEDSHEDMVAVWHLYRKDIGFRCFPANAEEYLSDLIKLAGQESKLAAYIVGRGS